MADAGLPTFDPRRHAPGQRRSQASLKRSPVAGGDLTRGGRPGLRLCGKMRRAAEGGVWGAITAPQHTKAEGVRGGAPSERRPACKQAGQQGEALRRLRRDVYRLSLSL